MMYIDYVHNDDFDQFLLYADLNFVIKMLSKVVFSAYSLERSGNHPSFIRKIFSGHSVFLRPFKRYEVWCSGSA